MEYEYVRRMYGVDPVPGHRVRHHVKSCEGTILPSGPSHKHYVQVQFDGCEHACNCHPTEMDYLGVVNDADPINLAGSGPVPIEPREG